MRLTGGEGKGKKLSKPPDHVRPTSGRVREVLFQIIADYLPGSKVLDLYAGAGLLGLEALARGANHACFVDNNRGSVRTIRKNINACGWEHKSKVFTADAIKWTARQPGSNYDLIFADPPYADPVYMNLLDAIEKTGILKEDGLLVFEAASRSNLPDHPGFTVFDKRKMGDTLLLLLKRS